MDNIDVKYSDDFILILDSIIKRQSNLIDHHVKILMNNVYYKGATIHEPDTHVNYNFQNMKISFNLF